MRFLPVTDRQYFDSFWESRAKRYLNDDVKILSYRILFGVPLTHDSEIECHRTCTNCDAYNKERCTGMEYGRSWRSTSKAEDNTQVAAGEYNYYELIRKRIDRNKPELYLILGKYRVDSFIEHLYLSAYDSVILHNKLNPKHKKEELKMIELKYWSSQDIMDTDMWLKYKNEKIEGEYLCSLLSDL